MNTIELLREHARDRPSDVALADGEGRRVTFQQLDHATSRVAKALRQAGLRPGNGAEAGDAVLILQPVSIELYLVLLAVMRARLLAMIVDPGAGRSGIAQACNVIAPRAMVGTSKACLLRHFVPALARIPVVRSTGSMGRLARRWRSPDRYAPLEGEPCPPETPALVTFTSGSTGVPKVAVRSHQFLLAQHRALAPVLGLRPGDRVVTSFPVFVLSHLGSGACTVLGDRVAGPNAIVAAPAWCEDWLASDPGPTSALRRVLTGGGPVFAPLLQSLQQRAPDAVITALYGSTEAEPIAHIDLHDMTPEDLGDMERGRGVLVGAPVDGINLRVLCDDFTSVRATPAEFDAACVPDGEPGEIVVSGEHVLPGYYRGVRDEETKLHVDGAVWHRTGDAGFLDKQGRVWLLGRSTARIRDRRGDLYPFQVEGAAASEAGVRRSALTARNGDRLLLVELEPGAGEHTLEKLEKRLVWAQLDRIVLCQRIPMDRRHRSKVDYSALEKIPVD